jgi:hypothetical protein
MSDAASRLRWRTCALLLVALGVCLAVFPSRGVSSELAGPKGEPEVFQAWPFDAAAAKRRQEETVKHLGITVERTRPRPSLRLERSDRRRLPRRSSAAQRYSYGLTSCSNFSANAAGAAIETDPATEYPGLMLTS